MAQAKLSPEEKRKGLCYQLAFQHVNEQDEGTLIHGEVWSAKLGRMIPHAWVETETGFIYEPVSDRYFNKDWLYKTYRMREFRRYSPSEAREWILRAKNYGPWETQGRSSATEPLDVFNLGKELEPLVPGFRVDVQEIYVPKFDIAVGILDDVKKRITINLWKGAIQEDAIAILAHEYGHVKPGSTEVQKEQTEAQAWQRGEAFAIKWGVLPQYITLARELADTYEKQHRHPNIVKEIRTWLASRTQSPSTLAMGREPKVLKQYPLGEVPKQIEELTGVPETPMPILRGTQESPVYIVREWPEVKGIFVGGCVARGVGSSFRAKAHSHNERADKYFGWICVRSIKRIGEVQGQVITKPSRLLSHEYAHILTPGHYHDDTWRKKMKELGQPIEKQYVKKSKYSTDTGDFDDELEECGNEELYMNNENTVRRTSPQYDGLVRHLGYEPVDSTESNIPTDVQIIEESQRRLSEVKVIPEHELTGAEQSHLQLARQIAREVSPSANKIHAAIIPPASDRVRTAGLYGRSTKEIFIALDQLDRGRNTVHTTAHELAHHTSGAEDGEEAHNLELKRLAGRVVSMTAEGRFDKFIAAPGFQW